MTEPKSLCRVDWKLGQALMPEHFLWQEDSLRREWEVRASHAELPCWGINNLRWDEELLRKSGRLLVNELELVFETGLMVSIPGNAAPVAMDLPEDTDGRPVDVYLHMDSSSSLVKAGFGDQEGNLIELRQQKLQLATSPLNTPLPAFHLGRMVPLVTDAGEGPREAPSGWDWDPTFAPPMVNVLALRKFGEARFVRLHAALAQWIKLLRTDSLENSLAVNKRVEAQMYLRAARGILWFLRQAAPHLDPTLRAEIGVARGQVALDPSIRTHPFELYRHAAKLYLDVFSFRASPLQLLKGTSPKPLFYGHTRIAECFLELEDELERELTRPGAGSPEWSFSRDASDGDRWVCELPQGLGEDAELYFLVQFEKERAEDVQKEEGLDRRLLGLRLAAPERLAVVEKRALSGIPLDRVRLVPFPHNFDTSTVQFYRLRHGEEWQWALRARKVSFLGGSRPISKCFLYSPNATGA